MGKYEISGDLKDKSIVLDFTNVSEGDGGQWVNKPGRYLFEVLKIEKQESKNSEYPNIVFTCEVTNECDQKGRKITEYCTLNPKGLFRLRNMLMALTDRNIEKQAIKVNFAKMLGRKFIGVVSAEEGQKGKVYHKITELLPASKWSTTDEEDDVPFDGADESSEINELDEDDLG